MNKELRIRNIRKKGFTLLFASLIVSLLLGVGLAILEITLQQLLLSSAGRESQFAFYNADSGVECGLYYDNKNINGMFFATDTPSANNPSSYQTNSNLIVCDNSSGNASGKIERVDSSVNSATTTFSIVLDKNICPTGSTGETYLVTVSKYINSSGLPSTRIQSRGYDTCDLNNVRRVERGLQVDY